MRERCRPDNITVMPTMTAKHTLHCYQLNKKNIAKMYSYCREICAEKIHIFLHVICVSMEIHAA